MTTCRWVMGARWFCVMRFCLVLLAVSVAVGHAQIQLKYDSGQNVAPVYEGWTRNADGTFDMVFGYMNRNHVEEPIVAVGPNNMFEPGDPRSRSTNTFLPATPAVHVQRQSAGGLGQQRACVDADDQRQD